MIDSQLYDTSSARLADRLASARRGRFVGREAELRLWHEALVAATPPFAVLFVYGPGGVGKTSLLQVYAQMAVAAGRTVIPLDGRDLEPTTMAFRAAIAQALRLPGQTPEQREEAEVTPWPSAPVLVLDTYERLAPLDLWLRERFLPQLPERSLVVIAGRNPPAPAWRSDLGWAELTHIVQLRNLHPEESRTYLVARGIPDHQYADALAFTHGHPLALALVADVLTQGDRSATFSPQNEPDVMRNLLQRFLQDVPSPHHRQALEVCAHARVTTEALLAGALGFALGAAQAPELFEWLRGLSFIEHGPRGLFPHDLAREVLDADLRWRNPDDYRQLHRQVWRSIVHKIQVSKGPEQQEAIFDWLFLHRNSSIGRSFLEWNSLGGVYAEPATAQDHPAILAMVEQHEGEISAKIAHYWLRRQPQAFTLFRNADQQAIGFVAGLILQTVTPEDLEADPAIRAAWNFVQRAGQMRSEQVREGDEITYKRFWMDCDTYQQAPSAALDLVSMLSVKEWLTRPKLTWSFAAYADPEFWQPLYTYISFQRAPEADFEIGGRRYAVFSHDWRAEPATAFLEVMAQRAPATAIGADFTEADPSAPPVVLSQPEFAEAVRQALRDFTRLDRLATNPLMRSRLVSDAAEQEPTPVVLQTLLREAVATLTANPKDMKFHRALWYTYFEPVPTQEQAAELLDLPFNTYRYHLAKGIEYITGRLWQRELHRTGR